MKRFLGLFAIVAAVMMTASTCDKESFKLYKDSDGNPISLIGAWGLIEVQYHTAGVVETHEVETESLMELMEGGKGRTLKILEDGSREEISTFHYEKFPGAITILTEEEYENHQNYTHEDSQYMPGITYYFKVIDSNTISSKEKVSDGSYLINIFARF